MPNTINIADEELLSFNGINGATGEYLFPAMTVNGLAKLALGQALDADDQKYISFLTDKAQEHFGVIGAEPSLVKEAGWGIVISATMENRDAILAALEPLLEYRREQVGQERFKRLSYIKDKDFSPISWLARHKVSASAVEPEKIPYYLLLVGSPQDISFRFQFTLDVQYAVGRVYFDTVAEYAVYAKQLVAREQAKSQVAKQAVLFGVKHDFDTATEYSIKYFIEPLQRALLERYSTPNGSWTINSLKEAQASKSALITVLKQAEPPAFVLTASHGIAFPDNDINQQDQGALICSDWQPSQWMPPKAIPPECYFSANDLNQDFNLKGMILCLFACYSGGVPTRDSFHTSTEQAAQVISTSDFLSRLPRQLLLAGASAVIAHVDRALAASFIGHLNTDNTSVFNGLIEGLFKGLPVGYAMRYLNDYYATMESEMSLISDQIKTDPFAAESYTAGQIASFYSRKVDARNYILIGDPAAHLNID